MILSTPPVVLLRYWLLQGMVYMNGAELTHRLGLEVLVALGLAGLIGHVAPVGATWATALILAHTLSAIFNGHPFAVLVHDAGVARACLFGDREAFLEYVEDMDRRLTRQQPGCLAGALIFGSIVRGVFRETSDLDIRYIAKPGFWNGIRAAHLVFKERLRAALSGFPMDIYMFRSRRETVAKMNIDSEPPVALAYGFGEMKAMFGDARSLAEMRTAMEARGTEPSEEKPPRAVVVASGGGHLTEALLAIEGVPLRATIATLELPHTAKTLKGVGWKHYYLVDPHGNVIKYLKNFVQSLLLVLRDRPDYVISTGAGMAIPTCVIGKLLGAKLIFIETAARVTTPSRTGRLLYPLADLFLVQWEPLLKDYPKAKYGGVLL